MFKMHLVELAINTNKQKGAPVEKHWFLFAFLRCIRLSLEFSHFRFGRMKVLSSKACSKYADDARYMNAYPPYALNDLDLLKICREVESRLVWSCIYSPPSINGLTVYNYRHSDTVRR